MLAMVVGVLLLGGAVAAAAVEQPDDASDLVRQATTRMDAVRSYRLQASLKHTDDNGTTVERLSGGLINRHAGEAMLTGWVATEQAELRIRKSSAYWHLGGLSAASVVPTPWAAHPVDPEYLDPAPPRDLGLSWRKVGTADARGAQTTRFSARLSPAQVAGLVTMTPMPVALPSLTYTLEVSIDGAGLIRRVQVIGEDSAQRRLEYTREFFEFGTPVTPVEVPAEADVTRFPSEVDFRSRFQQQQP